MTLFAVDECRDRSFGLGCAAACRGEHTFLDSGEANAGGPDQDQERIAARRSATRASTFSMVVSHEHMKRTPVAPTKL
jgi:hypothetical protein